MSKYTILSSPLVDSVIGEHLDIITSALKDIMQNDLHSVILTGGFGRGEGSVKLNDNIIHIVNDYDIEIIYKKKFNQFLNKLYTHLKYGNTLSLLANQLADQFKMKQIDLTLKDESLFSLNTPCTLANFDTKYGSIQLYGTENLVEKLPEYTPEDIPIFEGTWLLRNRGIGLLLAYFYLENNKVIANKSEYFYIEIIKSILAMGDALIIKNGTYHNSYESRKSIIESAIPDNFAHKQILLELYPLAAEYKLRPRDTMFEELTPSQLWNDVANIHCSLILYYETQRTGVKFESTTSYIQWAFKHSELKSKHRLRIMFDRLRGHTGPSSKYIHSIKHEKNRSVALTLGLLHAKTQNPEILDLLITHTKASQLKDMKLEDKWKVLTRDFLMAMHPSGELGKMLR